MKSFSKQEHIDQPNPMFESLRKFYIVPTSFMRCSLLCLLLFATLIAGQSYQLYSNYSVPTSSQQLIESIALEAGEYNITAFYCFGEVDWYVSIGYTPNITNYDFSLPFAGPETSSIGFSLSGAETLYFLFVCQNAYPGICAELDILVTPVTGNDSFDAIVPTPVQTVQGSLATGGESGSITWNKTGNPEDSYNVYWGNTTQPAGYFIATACAVRNWMHNLTQWLGTIRNNANNISMTASVNNLNPQVPFTVTVVVNRAGGYSNVYNSFTFNAGQTLVPSTLTAVMLLLVLVGILSPF